jgi:hypothetical protein
VGWRACAIRIQNEQIGAVWLFSVMGLKAIGAQEGCQPVMLLVRI